jgi:hypothetical protein
MCEAWQVDVFQFELRDLGVVETIEIGHDGTGAGAGWYDTRCCLVNRPGRKPRPLGGGPAMATACRSGLWLAHELLIGSALETERSLQVP